MRLAVLPSRLAAASEQRLTARFLTRLSTRRPVKDKGLALAVTGTIVNEEGAVRSDTDLIAAIAGGDEGAFRLLADRYTKLIFSLAYRMGFSRGQAEDALQETLLKLWQRAGDWDADRGASVRTWLCRIAVNHCIDMKRKTKRDYTGEMPEQVDPAISAQTMLEQRDTARTVRQAIADLPERQRASLVLFHYERMAVKDIAVTLQLTPKAVERLLDRARQGLRRTLAGMEGL